VDQKPAALPPFVFDADGLKLLAKLPDWFRLLPAPAILTPHPGEMSLLTGLTVEKIQEDRLAIAGKYAAEWGHVVVLKGAFTVIAAPDGRTTTIPVATPALAHAGTGDVLAGLITGLRAQGLEAYDAGRLGAWVHAQAGLAAAVVQGSTAAVLAGDVLEAVADVLAELE
jgi:NAD(P)H-hydrate epimerase